jgi:ABC-2 type transport system ATP-binding protein
MISATDIPLRVEHVRKIYPNGIEAVRDISLEIQPGEIFGLVGPNGAGKTTLLKLISGLLHPESGRILCGKQEVTSHPRCAAQYVGLMPDPLGVYTDVSAHEYLEFFARTMNLEADEIFRRITRTVALLELQPWLNEEVETLSAGWQRRLALGRILLADVPILLLDEPAAGLDISARSELLNIVRRLAHSGRTIIISSHILPELQQLADRFGIIYEGRWTEAAAGKIFFSREELMGGLGNRQWIVRCSDAAQAAKAVSRLPVCVARQEEHLLVFTGDTDGAGATALRAIINHDVDVFEFRREQLELSELVLKTLQQENKA